MSQATSAATADYLKKKHAHATQLEEELAMLPPKTAEHKKAALRAKLCEMYSDMLLHDPQYALRKDCLNRLWRNCFYGHISELRKRLSAEQKKKGSKVVDLTNIYNAFLTDAIQLYVYLVREYTGKLTMDLASSQVSLSGSNKLSQDSEIPPTPTASSLGVVNNLFRMYIHMGDLYRYSKNNNAADKSYLKASKLAPGKGNPYNQMAVVVAMQDTGSPLSCVAFYYYARSLLAVDDPFETSRENLLRLLEHNRVWLAQNPDDVVQNATLPKKVALALQRVKQSADSKRYLARFVDLHFAFIDKKDLSELELIQTFSRLLDTFLELTAVSAFSDSLLMKMVAINAFSVTLGKACLAKTFTLRFGTMIGARLEAVLAKVIESQTTKDPPARLLSPFMLLADYCLAFSWSMEDVSDLVATEAQGAENAFWTQVSSVANIVARLLSDYDRETTTMPKDYDSLRGYKPFCGFIESPVGVYITPEEAVRALGLDQSQTPASTHSSLEETHFKMAYFLTIVAKGEGTKVMKTEYGEYLLFSETQAEDAEVDMEVESHQNKTPEPALEESSAPSDDDLDDILEYKASGQDGTGPALLVPGAFLLNMLVEKDPVTPTILSARMGVDIGSLLGFKTKAVPPELKSELMSDPMDADPPRQAPGLSLLPGLSLGNQPPPGFTPPVTCPFQQEQPSLTSPPGYHHQPTMPPGFPKLTQSTMYDSLYAYPIHTANPFYSTPQPNEDFRDPYLQGADFLNEFDGSTFLDKSLLEHLWSDESPQISQNPFLT